ncbi:hypothetical protein [Fischerella thermalis]|nr:hypothetical protein [Fischerella thermalis]
MPKYMSSVKEDLASRNDFFVISCDAFHAALTGVMSLLVAVCRFLPLIQQLCIPNSELG